MFIPFLYALKARGVPVGAQEAVSLGRALLAGLHDASLDGFYHVARAILVHREAHLDDFDQVFLEHFRGVEADAKALKDELLDWLRDAERRRRELTDEERALLDAMMTPEELERLFAERLAEQTERHDGGSKWIGTGGTSPFGHSGAARQGIRVGGPGGGRSAIKTADARLYRGYRSDLTLDVRQMQVALRRLRAFAREGAEDELDLDGTIEKTAKNAGELEVVLRPPRKSNTRVLLLMDVGGSMDPYAHLVSRIFTAAKQATHFRELRTFYFHNCVYGKLYRTEKFDEPVKVRDVLHETGKHWKLILVGDALMAPYELMHASGAIDYGEDQRMQGIAWLMLLRQSYDRAAWLNPEAPQFWGEPTIQMIRQVFDMFPLTLDGLTESVAHLTRGTGKR